MSLVSSPGLIAHKVWRWAYTRRHPDHPWLSRRAIAFLDHELNDGMRMLEWGSGRSTGWFAARVQHVTSVEHDAAWHGRVREGLAAEGVSNVDLRQVPVSDGEAADHWAEHPYVMIVTEFADESLDVVLVDGLFRQNCVARVLPKISHGGLLAIDNARQLPALDDWRVPSDWELLVWSDRTYQDTAIWRRP